MATVIRSLAARFRTFLAVGAQLNQKSSSSARQTPQTGMACGRPSADAVTTQ